MWRVCWTRVGHTLNLSNTREIWTLCPRKLTVIPKVELYGVDFDASSEFDFWGIGVDWKVEMTLGGLLTYQEI